MAKIAVDVVLLPDKEISDKAIEISEELGKTSGYEYVLGKDNHLPHISLYMGVVDTDDVPEIQSILQNIAKNFSSLDLVVDGIRASKSFSTSELSITNTSELESLHQLVMERLGGYFGGNADKNMFYQPSEIDDQAPETLSSWAGQASGKNYHPHITIGIGDIGDDLSINFSASRIALAQSGHHCSCGKVLSSYDLKS
jgi:2'-5' RNA ligase